MVWGWACLEVKGRHRFLAVKLSLHLPSELFRYTAELMIQFFEVKFAGHLYL